MSAAQQAARVRNLEKARGVRAAKRAQEEMIRKEIVSLRSQVGAEMTKARISAGSNLRLGDVDEEYVPDLRSLAGRIRVFERMANDPNVRGQLRAITMTLISGMRFKIVGGDPKIRDLVAANLLREGARKFWCSQSWINLVMEMLGCLIYGFAAFHKSRAIVDDKYLVFSDLTWLHPKSIDEKGWITDEYDNLLRLERTFHDPEGKPHTMEPIEAEDLFLVSWDRRGPNFEGNAFIRPMYRPWLLNETAEKIDIIDLQNRGVGIPVAHLSGAGGVKERDTLVEILKSLRGGSKERAFIVLEKDEKVGFLLSEGQAKDAAPTLAHHRSNITKSGGTEYFEQGNTATGSRAGASALATGFFINVNGIWTILEDAINNGVGRQKGLVQEFAEMNSDDPGEIKEYPRLEGTRLSPSEQLDNIPLVQDAVAKGMLPPNIYTANEMLRRLGWPELSRAQWDEAMAAKSSFSPAFGGPGRPNEAGPDGQGRDDTEGRRLMLAEKKTPNTGGSRPSSSPGSWPWLGPSPS